MPQTRETCQVSFSVPNSRIGISRRPLGLYETVTVSGDGGRMSVSKIFGLHAPRNHDYVLHYPDDGSSVTLTGKTNLKGRVYLPEIGIVYGQMGSDFFNGEEISHEMMTESEERLPSPEAEALAAIEELMTLATEDVTIDSLQSFTDTVIVARKARIENGFTGSLQIFALDSITVGERVTLDYPSGLYSEKHVTIGDDSTVNGYVIVTFSGEEDIMRANYKQSRLARVRGLVYIDGIAQIQGIVSGVAMIDRAVYYSPRGYYENMFYDVTILENRETAWPLWFETEDSRRKEIKWVD